MDESHGAYYKPPTFWEKFWPRLGFHHAHAPRPDEDELKDNGWAPSWFMVETYVHLDWVDRLRLLISGKLHVEQSVKTDVVISKSSATSGFGILPPNTKPRIP